MVLKDDDPEALAAALDFFYTTNEESFRPWMANEPDDKRAHYADTLFFINLFQVADKYEFELLASLAVHDFGTSLDKYLKAVANTIDPEEFAADFTAIVCKVYDSGSGNKNKLISRLILAGGSMANVFGNYLGVEARLVSLLAKASKEVSEFGRDVLPLYPQG